MSGPTIVYIATYTVENRVISVLNLPDDPLSNYTGIKTYIYITYKSVITYIDLSKMLLLEPNIVLTQTIMAFLTARLTDLSVQGYMSEKVPAIDLNTGKFSARLNAYDALAAADVCVSYTSISDPSVRNNIYQRATDSDLVLTSKTRSFENCLVTVNGVFHPTQLFNGELFVLNGFSNIKNNEPNGKKVGIYDTTSLGGHTVIPLALTQVINTSAQDPTKGVYIQFPGVDFTGKTVLLSFGGYLYALDNAYQIVGKNRLRLNINKMDLINQFLHNPNTVYQNQYGSLAFNVAEFGNSATSPSDPVPQPTVQQEILYFLETQFPALTESQTANNPAMLTQYHYSDLYSFITDIVETLNLSDLTSAAFVYKILADPSSFLIVINNPDIFVKTYSLSREFGPVEYEVTSKDIPRGLLRYNHNKVFPYVILSGSTDHRHFVNIDYVQAFRDIYKTAYAPPTIPSPYFDIKNPGKRAPVELVELYAAA